MVSQERILIMKCELTLRPASRPSLEPHQIQTKDLWAAICSISNLSIYSIHISVIIIIIINYRYRTI